MIDRPFGAKERAGGAPTLQGAPRTRATSLSPHPIRGLFWLLNGGTSTPACALCMECISLGPGKCACATHGLFMRVFSTASGFLSITVKRARTALSERLRQPAVSAILAGLEQCFDLIVIPQERDEQVRWPVLKDEA